MRIVFYVMQLDIKNDTIVGNCITELAPVKQFYSRQVGDSEYKFFVVKKSAFWTELATVAVLQ